jgi:AraC-like DNA-binding protein
MSGTKAQKKLRFAAFLELRRAMLKPEKIAELTAGEIARRLGVSVANLSRAFRALGSGTLQYFIKQERFYCFHVQVWNKPSITLREALEKMDVRSPSHFIKEYKNRFDHTPGEYIKATRICWQEEQERLKKNLPPSYWERNVLLTVWNLQNR